MSMTPQEAQHEEWLDQLYEEHKDQAIEEFTEERLQSYYRNNPELVQPARSVLEEARNLLPHSARASIVLASVAIEVGLKRAILGPVVFGLVHDESVAGLITDLVIAARQSDYKNLLFKILEDHGNVNLDTYTREGGLKPLMQEYQEIQKDRNRVIHKAEPIAPERAAEAVAVATAVLEELFPRFIRYPLCLDDDMKVLTPYHPGP